MTIAWLSIGVSAFSLVCSIAVLVYVTRTGRRHQATQARLLARRRSLNAEARRVIGAGPGQVVHHIDGNPRNNDPANLRIVDPTENVKREQA